MCDERYDRGGEETGNAQATQGISACEDCDDDDDDDEEEDDNNIGTDHTNQSKALIPPIPFLT